jgi:hypothetical protein
MQGLVPLFTISLILAMALKNMSLNSALLMALLFWRRAKEIQGTTRPGISIIMKQFGHLIFVVIFVTSLI